MADASRNGGAEESLEGTVRRVRYHDPAKPFAIVVLEPSRAGGPEIILTGPLAHPAAGERLRARGRWIDHPQYGRQFNASAADCAPPDDASGLETYLAARIKGVGPKTAAKIVAQFGADTAQVLNHSPERLAEVPGITKKLAGAIAEAWQEQADQGPQLEAYLFLQELGLGPARTKKLLARYGGGAQRAIEENPYRLAEEISGIGFPTADTLARRLGIEGSDPRRLEAGLLHVVGECENDGHTWQPRDEILPRAAELLQASHADLNARIESLIESGRLRVLDQGVQSRSLALAEETLAQGLGRLLAAPSTLPPIKIESAVSWAQERAGFDFAPEQAEAIRAALAYKFAIITGGPGTGKTTILRSVVAIARAKKVEVLLASPTGRAAQRLAESTGQPAQTLHRALKFDAQTGQFQANEKHPLAAELIIIDEASMLDARLAAALARALPPTAHLVLVGDRHQLPSVGPGNVLADLIASNLAAVVTLQRIFRQGERSGIALTAHAILHGEVTLPPDLPDLDAAAEGPDLSFVSEANPRACREAVLRLCQALGGCVEVQVISPSHRGECGVSALNLALAQALNPSKQRQESFWADIPAAQERPRLLAGDKVIQTRNNHERGIFNGDIGRITRVLKGGGLAIDFAEQSLVLERGEQDDLQLAYAITVHKAQGSEFPVVVVPLLKQHYLLLQRNLLYTALTRGKQRVVLVGDPQAYRLAVRNAESLRRRTALPARLSGFCPS